MSALTSFRHLSQLTVWLCGLSTGDIAHAVHHRVIAIAVSIVAVVLRLFLGGVVRVSLGGASGSWCFVLGSPNGGWYMGGSCWVPPILGVCSYSVSELNSVQLPAELFTSD